MDNQKPNHSGAQALYDRLLSVQMSQGPGSLERALNLLAPDEKARSLSGLLEQVDRLKGWVDQFRPLPPSVVRSLKELFDVRFTYHSNAIEGNTLTQSETEMVLEQGITVGGKSLREHLEVIGHKEAIDYMEQLAVEAEAIGEREIKDLHSLVLRAIDREEAGRYRRLDVRAAGTEHVYPPHYRVPELMEEFARWLGSREAAELHPVGLAAEAHFRFVSIHPFQDGNGRAGRLLMNLLLLRRGYPVTVLRAEQRAAYIDALVAAQAGGGTGPLLKLVAGACRESLLEYLRVLATAGESRGRAGDLYERVLTALDGKEA
jgi:Fic family protein